MTTKVTDLRGGLGKRVLKEGSPSYATVVPERDGTWVVTRYESVGGADFPERIGFFFSEESGVEAAKKALGG